MSDLLFYNQCLTYYFTTNVYLISFIRIINLLFCKLISNLLFVTEQILI